MTPPRDAPIRVNGALPKEYEERLVRIAQLRYDFVIEDEPAEAATDIHVIESLARANARLLCWDPESRQWLTWAQWIFTRQPR